MTNSADTRRTVAERLRARRLRIARIRRRVLAGVAGTFVLAWGVIFVQLVSGHDPALAKHSPTTTSTSAAPTTSSSGSTSSGSTGSAQTGSAQTGSASPITTKQS